MTRVMSRVLEDIQELSSDEKSRLIQILIANLEDTKDENSDEEWANISLKRYDEIRLKNIETKTWNEIKEVVTNR